MSPAAARRTLTRQVLTQEVLNQAVVRQAVLTLAVLEQAVLKQAVLERVSCDEHVLAGATASIDPAYLAMDGECAIELLER